MESKIVLLVKEDAQDTQSLLNYYINPLHNMGVNKAEIKVLPLLYNTPSKIIAKTAKAYLDKLITNIPDTVTKLVIADSNYFKFITKVAKVSKYNGTAIKGAYEQYNRFDCVYVPSYKSLFKQPENEPLIEIGLSAIMGTNNNVLIESEEYALNYGEDREILDSLYQYDVLAVDIETTGLKLTDSIITIAFAWDKHNGVAINLATTGYYYTKKFFESYTGKLVFHNGLFDIKMMIRHWWMKHESDYAGMLVGLNYFTNTDDTMVLAYLAKNATTQVSLGLKENALEYVGNYAIDTDEISKHSKPDVLRYNLIDTLATMYLYEKYAAELTSEPYIKIFQPSIYLLLKIMSVGLPMDSHRVQEVHEILSAKEKVILEQISINHYVDRFNTKLQIEACEAANAKLKKTVKPLEAFKDVQFNPRSNVQLSKLLFTSLGLPILETTKSGAPSTDADTLADLLNHTSDPDIQELIELILQLADVCKINGTFIKAFMKEKDFLHGNLKLGGTQSGRLSSNNPNLTNLPSQGKMGKLVKSCIAAPDGWLFAGADFSSLEERIGAILSKDPNRIKVYTEGYDGHSMRAYKYFSDQMPDIDPNDVTSINSIEHKYPELRQKSKAPTFALQYSGTAYTLHKRSGFPMDQAEAIEKAFHDLYKVSDEFAEANKKHMEEHGYVECAFGLKLRTPIVRKTILDNSKTPYEAQAEVRSANNAVTQSWGMLLNRAMIATNNRIEEANYGKYILPINMIHDAGYFLVKNNPKIIKFLNDVLIEEMQWNDDDRIRSKDVPMAAQLEIGKSWDKLTKLKNNASLEEIKDVISTIT